MSTTSGPSDFTFLDKKYKADEWIPEISKFADELAKNAKILPSQRLPSQTDLNEQEQKDARMHIYAMEPLPSFMKDDMWAYFCASYLPMLHDTLKTLSQPSQKVAISVLVQILCLVGDPKVNPYFRRYLQSEKGVGLAQLVSSMVVEGKGGVSFFRPTGPGHISGLLINLMFWSPTSQGDDKRAAVNKKTRDGIKRWTAQLLRMPDFSQLEEMEKVDIERLSGVLGPIQNLPTPEDEPGYYLNSTMNYLEGQTSEICSGREGCAEFPSMRCTQCKTVRYCSAGCQKWHWKNGHKLRCHQTTF